jgi:excisionase family DNA binding protein
MDTTTITVIQSRPKPNLGTWQEAAMRLGCTINTIRNYVQAGKLTGYRVGPRMRRVDMDEVEALIEVAN